MWPFRRKPIVDDETAAWHVDNFAWLISEFGRSGNIDNITLVLPRPGYFPSDGETGHALAERVFRQVQDYCGMRDWEIDLIVDNNPLAERAPLSAVMVAGAGHAAGTFSRSGNRTQITYVPSLVQRPEHMVAVFAHELAHDLLSSRTSEPPIEEDEEEFLTDLTAVFLGFGVFLANARFDFDAQGEGAMQGWRWSRLGYLPEADLIFALALLLRLKNLDAGDVEGLKPHLSALLSRALRDLPETHPDVVRLREIVRTAAAAPKVP